MWIAAATALCTVPSTVVAEWTVIRLHPTGVDGLSVANAVDSGQQAGWGKIGGTDRAALWNGTAASWVNLDPTGASYSIAQHVHSGQQVGRSAVGGLERASLWSGTAASWIDLSPAGATFSSASSVHGGKQVGMVELGGMRRASLWSGSAASWVDLSPSGASSSEANGIDSFQQVGEATVSGTRRAGMWRGTSGSWVDLHPAGDRSAAYRVHNGQQVGMVVLSGAEHASVWSGSSASWVDLNPAGSVRSEAVDVYDGVQVGWADVSGLERASLWRGTAASWTDLGAFLPAEFTTSHARGVWQDANYIYVVGWGTNTSIGRNEALMWVKPIQPSGVPVVVNSWGSNFSGELGIGTTVSRLSPGPVAGLTNVTAVACGGSHALALLMDGTAKAWGSNGSGRLGDGTTTNRLSPVSVTGLSGVNSIGAGGSHSLALRSDGTVMAWGLNSAGQLGDGTLANRLTPVSVLGIDHVIRLAGGGAHSLALLSDGTVRAWGSNGSGRLGDGTTTNRPMPTPVEGLSNCIAISAGDAHSLALQSNGIVMAWGSNGSGRLGDGTTTDRLTPVPVPTLPNVVSIAAGGSHSLAVDASGKVWAWGNNLYGQLGAGNSSAAPVVVPGLSGITSVEAIGDSSFAWSTDGRLWSWGRNNLGQLGLGDMSDRGAPAEVPAPSGHRFDSIAGDAGGRFVFAALRALPSSEFRVCCLPDQLCTYIDPTACPVSGFVGPVGLTCTPNPCPLALACCYPDGSCTFVLADACVGAGVLGGSGSACTPNTCPRVRTVRAAGPGTVPPWTTAVPDLQTALLAANPGDEVWIASGTYRPDMAAGSTPATSFVIPTGVRVYGGFAGTESSPDERNADLSQNVTILDGHSSSWRVVVAVGTSASTLLDRVTIAQGAGPGQVYFTTTWVSLQDSGPGMSISGGSQLSVRNVTFSGNTSGRMPHTDSLTRDGRKGLAAGAVLVRQSSPVFIDCVFIQNRTSSGSTGDCAGGTTLGAGYGGDGGAFAAYDSAVTFVRCQFLDNIAGDGGIGGSCSQQSGSGGAGGRGGAIYAENSILSVDRCVFTGNRAGSGGRGGYFGERVASGGVGGGGGALHTSGGVLSIKGSTLRENFAGNGGGVFSFGFTQVAGVSGGHGGGLCSNGTTVVVENTLVAGNRGGNGSSATQGLSFPPTCALSGGDAGTGGAFVGGGSLAILGSTLVANEPGTAGTGTPMNPAQGGCPTPGLAGSSGVGGVLVTSGAMVVKSSVLWGNTNGQYSGASATISSSCVQGGAPGTGNTSADPMFVNPALSNYRLSALSPCIDSGDNTSFSVNAVADVEGLPRFVSACIPATLVAARPPVDMGALEFQGLPDCNSDGQCDARQLQGIDVLTSLAPANGDLFGWAIGMNDHLAIVGARAADTNGSDSGAVVVYERTGAAWGNPIQLTPTDGSAGDEFGNQVAITDTFAVVASRRADVAGLVDAGAVYVFRKIGTGWQQVQKLVAPDPVTGGLFGHGIDLSGSRLAIGALGPAGGPVAGSGAAYVYRLDGASWVFEAEVHQPSPANGTFGLSVAVDGDTLVVGSPSYDPLSGPSAGAAYVYQRVAGTWTLSTTLSPPTPQAGQTFAELVALSGDTMLVNAPRLSHTGKNQAGAVYAYLRTDSAWGAPVGLVSNQPADQETFGFGLALDGNQALIGGFRRPVNGIADAGWIYLYRQTAARTWLVADRIPNPAPEPNAFFGYGLAFAGNRAIAGAIRASAADVPAAGVAWTFDLGAALDINDNLVPDSCEILAGTQQDNDGNGIPDAFQFNPCRADFNGFDGVTIDDLFLYLNAWFTGNPLADIDGVGGVAIDDLFLFLNGWFVGCM